MRKPSLFIEVLHQLHKDDNCDDESAQLEYSRERGLFRHRIGDPQGISDRAHRTLFSFTMDGFEYDQMRLDDDQEHPQVKISAVRSSITIPSIDFLT